jgi:hypothetical protein
VPVVNPMESNVVIPSTNHAKTRKIKRGVLESPKLNTLYLPVGMLASGIVKGGMTAPGVPLAGSSVVLV